MLIKDIKLTNFRNFNYLSIEFLKGINFIYGNNAEGKTNIVEAIYFLSLGRSFKSVDEKYLIKKDQIESILETNIDLNGTSKHIKIILKENGKEIFINNVKIKKLSELSNIFNVIYFIPQDANLLKENPQQRRKFLNLSIFKLFPQYLQNINRFEKILNERNQLLKDENIDFTLLDILTSNLIKEEKEIYLKRNEFINKINIKINSIYKLFTGSNLKLKVNYVSFIQNKESYEKEATDLYKKSLNEEIKRKITLNGVQKDDFYILKDGKNLAKYGSQGENRFVILLLKLSVYELYKDYGIKSVLILDDVLSELDKNYVNYLVEYIKTLDQVFITSIEKTKNIDRTYYYLKDYKIAKEE